MKKVKKSIESVESVENIFSQMSGLPSHRSSSSLGFSFTISPVNTLAFAHLFTVARQMGCAVVDLHTCPKHVELTALGQHRQTAMSAKISEFFVYTRDVETQVGLPCASMQRLFKNIEHDDTIRLSMNNGDASIIDVTLVTKNHSLSYTVSTVEPVSSQVLTKEGNAAFSMSAPALASTCKNLLAFGPAVTITLCASTILFGVEGHAETARLRFGGIGEMNKENRESNKNKDDNDMEKQSATFSLANLSKITSGGGGSGKFGSRVDVNMWNGEQDGTALLGLEYDLSVLADASSNCAKFYIASQCL